MKTKKLSIVIFALVAACLLASCKKNNGTDAPKQGFAASTEQGDDSKTHLSGTNVMWNAYDQIKVASQDNPTTQQYTFELTDGANTKDGTFYTGASYVSGFFDVSLHDYVAIYPATAGNTITGASTADITLPQEQSTQSNWQNSFGDGAMAMMSVSGDRTLQFKNLLGGLCLQLTGLHEHVTELWITSNDASEYLWGQFTASWNSGEPTLTHKSGGTGNNTVKLKGCGVTTSGTSTLSQTFYILLPPQTLKTGFTLSAYNGTTKVYEHTATWASNNAIIQRSRCRRLDPSGSTDPSEIEGIDISEGALQGLFSVAAHTNPSDPYSPPKRVYFSKGNLQYQASTNTWRFAEHQWDYVGDASKGTVYEGGTKCNNASISSSYAGWIDLFGFGTSGYNGKVPYQTSGTASDYGNGDNELADTEYEWGYHNAISNGGGASRRWRSLEGTTTGGVSPVAGDHTVSGFPVASGGNEWYYLMHLRSQTYRYAFAQITVASGVMVNGLILFPDGFNTLPAGVSALVNYNQGYTGVSPYVANYVTYTNNPLTLAQWNILEAANAVFLPASGYRQGTDVKDVNDIFRYWTSSPTGETNSICLRINSDGTIQTGNGCERTWGFPIRLVCDYVE